MTSREGMDGGRGKMREEMNEGRVAAVRPEPLTRGGMRISASSPTADPVKMPDVGPLPDIESRADLIGVHTRLAARTVMNRALFDRWLELFRQTVSDRFAGERADHLIRCAEDMANVIHSKIDETQTPRVEAARISPEQRSRDAAYRADGG